jgi:alpha-mannosidase
VAIANQHVRVGFDRKSGGIVSLIDVASGIEVATGEAMAVPEYGMERAVGMSAWVLGDVPRREAFACTACDVTQNGPWVAAVRSEFARGDSKFTVEYTVRAGQPWVEVAISGTWMEKGAANIGVPRLAMRFPFALDGARARYEIPAGAIARSEPAGREVPALRWAAVDGAAGDAGRRAGCALFNDGKHGHSVDGGTLQLNLIRSSYDPDPLPEIGQHQIRLGLAPWAGERDAAAITRMAAAFNQPTQVVGTSIHRGSLPAGLAAGIACDRAEVMVTQVKGAEDGAAVVIRVPNTAERAVAATLTLAEAVFGRVAGAVATDLLERPVAGRTAAVAGQQVTVTVPAQGLATVAVECR